MKKWLFLICFIILLPNVASAHAELESSQPQEGETVKQNIDTLTLQFGEEVEKFISFTLTNDKGESIPIGKPAISGKTVLVMTDDPLPNGSYTAKWELVAADGHQNPGQLSFKVGQEAEKKQAASNPPADTKNADQHDSNPSTSGHGTLYMGIIIVLVVIVCIAAAALFRKKGK